ncbi:lmo0937 family membrane protein [Salipaludibacillus sp. CUR1]|nr:lmo0937 family membrane protein [Salipaludibacillus sp. CUR1]MCE7791641.1 lmo0937 family membrane protein [Salipaludibacillus sp. CUR1]
MIWTIIGIILLFWLIGFAIDIAGGLIHLLLVVALVVFIVNMIRGR